MLQIYMKFYNVSTTLNLLERQIYNFLNFEALNK